MLQNPDGTFRGSFHRRDADACPGRRRGEVDRNDYVLVDLDEKGLFAYCVEVAGEGADVTVGDPSLVSFRKPVPVDEVDLGPGAALLSPTWPPG